MLTYSNGDFNIVRGGARSGGLVKLDRDFGDYEADHESREDVLGGVRQKKGRRVNGRRGRRHRRGRRMKKGKNQNQRGGRKKTERRRKNDTRSREYLDRR